MAFGTITAAAQIGGSTPPVTETQTDTVHQLSDSLRKALPDTIWENPAPVTLTTLVLNRDQLAEIDHQEFSDFVRLMPGFYPLDRAGLATPAQGLMLGLSAKTLDLNFRGRRIEDHLLGAPDLSWIPPEALSRLDLTPLPLTSPGARVDAWLSSLESLPPASRISVRDGFYGLGTVDFDLAQKITPAVILNAGGRVTTFEGRYDNNAGYGLNLRTEVGFRISPELGGWGGLMQNRLNSGVPYAAVNHNRERYDADFSLAWKQWLGNVYGYDQRETYSGSGSDRWQELGLILGTTHRWGTVTREFHLQAAQSRWRLNGLDWATTTSGGVNSNLTWTAPNQMNAVLHLGLDVSDDFSPERHLGLSLEQPLFNTVAVFAGATQHQENPTRFETSANFLPGTHFLPFDSILYLNPTMIVQGNQSLVNETYNTLFSGIRTKSEHFSGSLAAFWRRVDDPIAWHVEDSTVVSYNAERREDYGLMGWTVFRPGKRLEFGVSASWLPRIDQEKRLFPENIAHAWAQYSQPLIQNDLLLRLRVWSDFWGQRQAPTAGSWTNLQNDAILSARISAYMLGVHFFWEVRNATGKRYYLTPDLEMMHKEEVWGVAWNFRN